MDLVTPGQQQKLAALERVAARVTPTTTSDEQLTASLMPMGRRLTAFGVVLGTVVGLLWLLT